MPRNKTSQPGSRPPTPEDAGLEAEPPMASGGVLHDARAVAASSLELPQAQLAELEARLMDRLGAQIGDQLTRMQAQMQSQLQSQMQALATLLKSQQPTPSTAAERMVTAAAATLPPLSTLQPRSEEVAEQLPRLPPPVTVSTQHPAPVASYLAPVLGGQPDADAGDRRDTLGHQ